MSQVHDIAQGSDLWHEFRATHYGASECAAMLGISPYKTRSQLLHEKHTGIVPDVDAGTQSRFADGHRFEALARPLAEKIIGEALSPVTISDGKLSASLDGITFDDTVIWEHKTLSNGLEQIIERGQPLPDMYLAQMEQQLMLSGAAKCLFMASKWNGDTLIKEMHQWYESDPLLRERILAGWAQFAIDLAAYVPPEVIPEVVAAPIKDLPAITYKMDGMHLSTNLRNDVKPAILALVEQSKRPLVNDQDFADLDALCKKFKQAEEQCALVQSQAVGEIKDVDAFCRDLKELSEIMRQARIAGEKAVTTEKDARKLKILQEAKNAYARHTGALHEEIKPIILEGTYPDFAGAMKGLKKLSAMQEAVDNALRDGKMMADSAAQDIRAKLAWFTENALSHNFLFHDLQQIIGKQSDDFKLLVTTRIEKHKAEEAAKIERIRAEEKAKAEAAAAEVFEAARIKAEQEARKKVEDEAFAKNAAEIKALEAATGAPQERGRGDVQLTHHNPADEAAAIEARRKQSQIAEQSKPFNGAPAKTTRPSDKEIINMLQMCYPNTPTETICDWIIDVAEGLRVAM